MKVSTKTLAVLGLYSAIASMEQSPFKSSGSNDGSYGHGIPDQPKKIIPKGCREFTIDGVTVVALNEKSAIKKAKKLNK